MIAITVDPRFGDRRIGAVNQAAIAAFETLSSALKRAEPGQPNRLDETGDTLPIQATKG